MTYHLKTGEVRVTTTSVRSLDTTTEFSVFSRKINLLCIFTFSGCLPLNLCGTDSASCCKGVVTFLTMVQTVYVLCSGSPELWAILKSHNGTSIQGFFQELDGWIEQPLFGSSPAICQVISPPSKKSRN